MNTQTTKRNQHINKWIIKQKLILKNKQITSKQMNEWLYKQTNKVMIIILQEKCIDHQKAYDRAGGQSDQEYVVTDCSILAV